MIPLLYVQESLCDLLDRRGSECLNQKDEHPYTDALLPGPLQYLESDDDEQLIISLRFKTTVRLHSLQLTGPLNGRAPKTVRLFVNQVLNTNYINLLYYHHCLAFLFHFNVLSLLVRSSIVNAWILLLYSKALYP